MEPTDYGGPRRYLPRCFHGIKLFPPCQDKCEGRCHDRKGRKKSAFSQKNLSKPLDIGIYLWYNWRQLRAKPQKIKIKAAGREVA